jgi:hypothetical protein
MIRRVSVPMMRLGVRRGRRALRHAFFSHVNRPAACAGIFRGKKRRSQGGLTDQGELGDSPIRRSNTLFLDRVKIQGAETKRRRDLKPWVRAARAEWL